MAFILGLVLTPLAALIGTLLLVISTALFSIGELPSIQEWWRVAFFGVIIGSMFSAPVTLVALPACYAILRHRRGLGLGRLALAGGLFGFASTWIVGFWFWRDPGDAASALVLDLRIACVGAVTGVICGAMLGWVLRKWEPQAWAPPAVPTV